MSTKVKKTPFLKLAAALVVAAFVFTLGACPGVDSAADQAASQGNGQNPVQNPKVALNLSEFEVKGLEKSYTFDWEQKEVKVTHKAAKYEDDDIIVTYKDTVSGTESTVPPMNVSEYEVSFYVEPVDNTLNAGTLVINKALPKADHYEITGLVAKTGEFTGVEVQHFNKASGGKATPYYEGISPTTYSRTTTEPQEIGTYKVTLDVEEETNFAAEEQLWRTGWTLEIKHESYWYDTLEDYDFIVTDPVPLKAVYDGTPKRVVVAYKDEHRGGGRILVYYKDRLQSNPIRTRIPPTDASTYGIYIDVVGVPGWNPVADMHIGDFEITQAAPKAEDFTFENRWNTYDGTPKALTITHQDGLPRNITTSYTGIYPTVYGPSSVVPSGIGRYAVTFRVGQTPNYFAATNLSAGTLYIRAPAAKAEYYDFDGLGEVTASGRQGKAVSITPKPGTFAAPPTKIWYEGIDGTGYAATDVAPYKVGKYLVTFDVPAVQGHFRATSGLVAEEQLVITNTGTPKAADYEFSGLEQYYVNESIAVEITPKDGASKGKRTPFYNGLASVPTDDETGYYIADTYTVTFNVAKWRGWNAAENLPAGTLTIQPLSTPTADDYNFGLFSQTEGSGVTAVSITPTDTASPGEVVNIRYNGSTTVPNSVGEYAVTFDVEAARGWTAATGLVAPDKLEILERQWLTPDASHYDYSHSSFTQTEGNVTHVTITAKAGYSLGAVGNYQYESLTYSLSGTPPQTAGTYTVFFSVDADGDWNSATLTATQQLLVKSAPVPGADKDYRPGGDAELEWGTTAFTPTTLVLTPGNDTTEIKLNWYSTGSQSGKSTQVRFVQGTFAAGKELLTQEQEDPTKTVNSAGTSTYHKATVKGLIPGESYQYAVSIDGGKNWSSWVTPYEYEIPANIGSAAESSSVGTGSFKFAVITDPQLHTGPTTNPLAWDGKNRYTPSLAKSNDSPTGAAWAETVAKIKGDHKASFIVSAGDQVDATSGVEAEFNLLLAPSGLRSLPFAPAAGNHETYNNAYQPFYYHFNWPGQTSPSSATTAGSTANYFYRYNNVLFVSLDTKNGINAAAVTAATKTLNDAKAAHAGKYDWIIVHHHQSTTSVGQHGATDTVGFSLAMSNAGVHFVLAGHDHVYTRSYPLEGMSNTEIKKYTEGFEPEKSTWASKPRAPIYFTFSTASGLKYYFVQSNADTRPNVAYAQPYIPSYTIVEVEGKNKITFKTYALAPDNGVEWNYPITTKDAPSKNYKFDEEPFDWITVTK